MDKMLYEEKVGGIFCFEKTVERSQERPKQAGQVPTTKRIPMEAFLNV